MLKYSTFLTKRDVFSTENYGLLEGYRNLSNIITFSLGCKLLSQNIERNDTFLRFLRSVFHDLGRPSAGASSRFRSGLGHYGFSLFNKHHFANLAKPCLAASNFRGIYSIEVNAARYRTGIPRHLPVAGSFVSIHERTYQFPQNIKDPDADV